MNIYKVILLLFVVSLQVEAQKDVTHSRSIVSEEESWEPGIIIKQQHVIDSFFYENGTHKEVAESIITSRMGKVLDSIATNTREVWDDNGNLLFKEFFKKGQIHKVKSFYPDQLNIIENGSFEVHDDIPKLNSYERWWKLIGSNPALKEIQTELIDSFIYKGDTFKKFRKITYLDSFHHNYEDEIYISKNETVQDSFIIMKRKGGGLATKEGINRNYEVKAPGWMNRNNNKIQVFDFRSKVPYYPFWRHNLLKNDVAPVSGNACARLKTKEYAPLESTTIFQNTRFLTANLKTWLEKNNYYYLEFWVWVWPGKKTDDLGELSVCFSKETIGENDIEKYKNKKIDIKPLKDIPPYSWAKISFSFKAKEDARYMTVGNFNDNWKQEPKKVQIHSGIYDAPLDLYPFSSECYLDDFILVKDNYKNNVAALFHMNVEPSDSSDTEPVLVFNGEIIKENQSIILENIYFDFNSSELLPASYAEIDNLIELLNEHNDTNLKISGHTDNVGTDGFNRKLSEQRAKAVCDYIIGMGISQERLSWQGFGNQMPIADNNTEEGRQKNRRVEFQIITEKQDTK